MTVNQIIIEALKSFGIPIVPNFYEGESEEYITFNYADDRAALYADNDPVTNISYMQIHYFLPSNKDYLEDKKKMRKALHKSGFTYPGVTELVESDNKIRHIIFECEIENEYEMEE